MKEILYKRAIFNDFPAIRVLAVEHADAELLRLVKQAVNEIDLGDPELFPEPHRLFFALIKHEGADSAVQAVESIPDKDDGELYYKKRDVFHRLGSVIFNRLPRHFFPFHDLEVVPRENEWLVRVRAVRSTVISGQTIYYSPHEPKIEVNGQKKIVAFTYHAIKQTCNRIYTSQWRTYWGNADVFAFFADCVHFEPTALHPGDKNPSGLGFTFFNTCALDSFRAEIINIPNQYALHVVGFDAFLDHKKHGTRWFYRVGYGSAFLLGDFIVAATVLYPGHTNTPEYGAIVKSGLTKAQKEAMKQKARKDQQIDDLLRTMDFSTIKWFHDHGIPQVISLPHDIFARKDEDPTARKPDYI